MMISSSLSCFTLAQNLGYFIFFQSKGGSFVSFLHCIMGQTSAKLNWYSILQFVSRSAMNCVSRSVHLCPKV